MMICLWSSTEPCCCVKASCVSLSSTTDLFYIQHTIFKKNTGLTSLERLVLQSFKFIENDSWYFVCFLSYSTSEMPLSQEENLTVVIML